MSNFKKSYQQIIAILECADGNEKVGSMWHETRIFNKSQSINDVIQWAGSKSFYSQGRLILTVPD